MADPGPTSAGSTSGRLDERVLTTLEARAGRVPFSGLRRTLKAHPESLSRALRRLEREGLVERSPEGYRAVRGPAGTLSDSAELRVVARIELPVGVEPEQVLDRLSGRWFGSLRWMGVVERTEGRLLSWARRDGTGSVLLGTRAGAAEIQTSADDRVADLSDAEDAAYELLVAVAEVLRPHGVRGGTAFLTAGDTPAPHAAGGRDPRIAGLANN